MTVLLSSEAREVIESEAKRFRLAETGGPLFGSDNGFGDIEIAFAYGPGRKTRHLPTRLFPDRDATQRRIDHHFDLDAGRTTYIGEWHTHPGGLAVPSGRDKETLRQISTQKDVLLPKPLALILETRPFRRSSRVKDMKAYQWDPDKRSCVELEILEMP